MTRLTLANAIIQAPVGLAVRFGTELSAVGVGAVEHCLPSDAKVRAQTHLEGSHLLTLASVVAYTRPDASGRDMKRDNGE